ncbi:MAG: phospholipid carrier-dependent glycosyltransferase [Chloroflexus sp.]|uniref:phospholipid carrier-dependent glycosyltransferase n=1 Tax=Chloroflexus sp. TaxID=1904827 RepID=UPI0030B44321
MRLGADVLRKSAKWLVTGMVVLLVLILFSGSLDSYRVYHPDETFWIRSGQWTFQKMFIERDFSSIQWTKTYTELFSHFGPRNPNLVKIIIGASLYWQGFTDIPKVSWDWSLSTQANIDAGNAVPRPELSAGRYPIVLLTALTAGILFLIGFCFSETFGWIYGLFIVGFFLSHPLVEVLGKLAMLDIPAIFFSLVSVYCAWRGIHYRSGREAFIFGIGSGLSSGLAVSAKLNAGLVIISILIIGITNLYLRRTRNDILFILPNLILPVLIFLVVNPQIWHDLLTGIRVMLEHSQIIAARRSSRPNEALWTINDALRAFQARVFGDYFHLALWITGCLLMKANLKQNYPFVVYGFIVMAGVIAWTPLNWDRFYLPAVPFYAIVLGYTLGSFFESLFVRMTQKHSMPMERSNPLPGSKD